MKSLGIIPARYASTRFPAKPLAILGDKPMIQWVYERALRTNLTAAIVATDDQRIYDTVKAFGGEVMMTSIAHQSGTDRCAEVAQQQEADIVVNIQGDEPFFPIEAINLLLAAFAKQEVEIATLAHPLAEESEIFSPNVVKLTRDQDHRALYFSRHPIPYFRNLPKEEWAAQGKHLQHLGVYAFRKHILLEVSQLQPSGYELAESLEQLRWLEAGYQIYVYNSPTRSIGIDTPEDLEKAKQLI